MKRADFSPFDISEARASAREASSRQSGAEGAMRDAYKDLAAAEQTYRVALAKERLRLHAEDKVAWTATDDIAKGEEKVARFRYDRDVAKGVAEAAQSALWRMSADRKDVGRFIEWSMRRELAENGAPEQTGPDQPIFGGRRAA